MILTYDPLRVFMPVGLLLLVIAAGKTVYDVIDKDGHVATNTLLLYLAGFQVVMIGLLADLMVRLTRPKDEVLPAALSHANLAAALQQGDHALDEIYEVPLREKPVELPGVSGVN